MQLWWCIGWHQNRFLKFEMHHFYNVFTVQKCYRLNLIIVKGINENYLDILGSNSYYNKQIDSIKNYNPPTKFTFL